MTRILVTGSRKWRNKAAILRALCEVITTCNGPAEPTRPKRWVYSNVEYAKMRARKLTDWFLP